MSTPTNPSLVTVRPIEITPAMLVEEGTNVPETDYAEYTPGTIYAKGERCIVVTEHAIYQSAVDGNQGNDPAAQGTQEAPKWKRVGATNRWRATDKAINTQLKQAGKIKLAYRLPRPVNYIALLNVDNATTACVRVKLWNGEWLPERVFSFERRMEEACWWHFWFGEWNQPTQALFADVMVPPNAEMHIELNGGDELAMGVLLAGQAREWGIGVEYGDPLGIRNFSTTEQDPDFGDITLVERDWAAMASFSVLLRPSELDPFYRYLAAVRAKAILYIGSSLYEAMVVFGVYDDFEVIPSGPTHVDGSLQIKGLI